MNKLLPLIASLSAIIAIPVMAESKTSGDIDLYVGLKTGYMYTAYDELDPKIPVGALVGIQKNGFGLELEGNYVDMDAGNLKVDYESYAIYATYRTSGKFYAKLRAGYLEETLKSSTDKWEESGFSGGVAFGVEIWSLFTIEAGYTVIEADLKYFSLGANLHF